jgi:hypothetical protein
METRKIKQNTKMIDKHNYIIDFERVNQLTSTHYSPEKANSSPFSDGQTGYTLSRKLINSFLDKFTGKRFDTDYEEMEFIINTLVYNKILITKADIRNEKINNLIKDE